MSTDAALPFDLAQLENLVGMSAIAHEDLITELAQQIGKATTFVLAIDDETVPVNDGLSQDCLAIGLRQFAGDIAEQRTWRVRCGSGGRLNDGGCMRNEAYYAEKEARSKTALQRLLSHAMPETIDRVLQELDATSDNSPLTDDMDLSAAVRNFNISWQQRTALVIRQERLALADAHQGSPIAELRETLDAGGPARRELPYRAFSA